MISDCGSRSLVRHVSLRDITQEEREIVKKENKENKPKTPELPFEQTEDEPSSNHVSKATTPTPQPSEEFHSLREASFIQEPSVPELPPIEIPELPEIPEKKRVRVWTTNRGYLLDSVDYPF